MNKEQIVGIAARLFSVFLFVYTFRYASTFLPYLSDTATIKLNKTFILLMMLFPFAASILLWMFPLTIARKLLPKVKPDQPKESLQLQDIEIVASTILGLWVLSDAIPETFKWVTVLYATTHIEHTHFFSTPYEMGAIVAAVMELIIGLWLTLGSKGVFGFVRRLRYAGS